MSSLTLSFNEVKLNPVPQQQDNQIWLSSGELANALGYKSIDSVTKIYTRNSDEFTNSMTLTVNLTVSNKNNELQEVKTRIFSLRGCHLIAFFARTAVAKEFRKWVLDVLDKEVGQPTLVLEPQTHIKRTTKDKRTALHEAIALLMTKSKYLHFKDCYKIIHQRFNVNHLDEIAEEQLPEAVQYVHSLLTGGYSQQSELKILETLCANTTNKVMDYYWALHQEIKRLGGKSPDQPNLDEETIVRAVITRMVQGSRMMLHMGYDNKPTISLIPNDSWLLNSENIAQIVGDPCGPKKELLPEIIQAAAKRLSK